jgi:hypothetical protein
MVLGRGWEVDAPSSLVVKGDGGRVGWKRRDVVIE